MAIVYDKLFQQFEERGITSYTLKKNNVIGQATLKSIKNGTGGLDYRSINKLCSYLDCQPADIMEYVPDQQLEEQQSSYYKYVSLQF